MIKEEKENLERQYIRDFEAYFINKKIDINNSEEISYIKETIKNVARLEIEEMGGKLDGDEKEEENVIKLEFTNNLKENVIGAHEFKNEFEMEYAEININIAKLIKELSSDDSEVRKKACFLCFHALFHEIQHERQRMLTKLNISSKYSILFAKEFVLKTILENEFYEKENYDRFAVEIDAKTVGLTQLIDLMKIEDEEFLNNKELHEIEFILSRYKKDAKNKYSNNSIKFQDEIDREDLFEEIVLTGLVNEDVLWKYPILKKEYKTKYYGGIERKSTLELIKGLEDEIAEISSLKQASDEEKNILINSIKDMYYHMIFRSMQKDMPENVEKFILSDNRKMNPIVEYYKIIEYMGKDGLENLIRRDKKKLSK